MRHTVVKDGKKPCTACKLTKPVEEFDHYVYTTTNGGRSRRYDSLCKKCKRAKYRARYKANPEPHKQYTKKWLAADPKRAFITRKKAQLKKQYGLTLPQYEKLVEDADGKCEACGEPFNGTPNVDHCHSTKRVRGLLCTPCNCALGYLKDDPRRILSLLKYLEERSR